MRIAEEWKRELEREFEQDILIDLRARLRKGAQGSGLTLTGPECAVLMDNMQPLIRRDRRRDRYNHDLIALASFVERGSVEAAVTHTARRFGVSRATVFEARRKQKSRYSQK